MNFSTMNVCACVASFITVVLLLAVSEAKLAEGDCEVCIAVVKKIEALITDEVRKDSEKIEKKVRKFCKGAMNSKENRFCYYIGGTADAATGMLHSLTKPLHSYVPAEIICEKLKKKDHQVCEIKYEKQIDLDSVDLKKLKVKDLKKILSDWGEDCRACTEKKEFVDRINELRDKHAPKKQEL